MYLFGETSVNFCGSEGIAVLESLNSEFTALALQI